LSPPPPLSVVSRAILGICLLAGLFLINAPAVAQHTFTLTGPATITETDSDANTVYTINRTGPTIMSGDILAIRVTFVAGTATAADFSGGTLPALHAVSYAAGGTSSNTFQFGIAGDNLPEADETFTIYKTKKKINLKS